MAKHAVPIENRPYVTAEVVALNASTLVAEFSKDRPQPWEEVIEQAIETMIEAGMAPPDLDPREEEDFAFPHSERALLGMVLLGIVAPEFATHLTTRLKPF